VPDDITNIILLSSEWTDVHANNSSSLAHVVQNSVGIMGDEEFMIHSVFVGAGGDLYLAMDKIVPEFD
jgi:hypothetical protein